ncbi:phosphoribosylformylglycinamidine synthase subunit PurS [Clostridia bacterium]|nr:phosphoribosylformylglycinamidine synthase subunit PurS [Clostridia bacterium]
MHRVKIYITLKKSVLDPQGEAVKNAAKSLGYSELANVRIGKYMELEWEGSDQDIQERLDKLCDQLLANPVMEEYHYEMEKL